MTDLDKIEIEWLQKVIKSQQDIVDLFERKLKKRFLTSLAKEELRVMKRNAEAQVIFFDFALARKLHDLKEHPTSQG